MALLEDTCGVVAALLFLCFLCGLLFKKELQQEVAEVAAFGERGRQNG